MTLGPQSGQVVSSGACLGAPKRLIHVSANLNSELSTAIALATRHASRGLSAATDEGRAERER